jgi:phenylpyruvate tautomerase PptA (4-oxalocrotonate tautomerase family)
MPSITIEVRRAYTEPQEIAIMEAVHAAVVAAFRIPEHDRSVRLVVHKPHRFDVPPQLTQPEYATVISIDAFSGRSLDAKRNLYRTIVDNLEALGIPRDHVKVLVRDVPRENWGIRGGQAGCDLDIGFTIEV